MRGCLFRVVLILVSVLLLLAVVEAGMRITKFGERNNSATIKDRPPLLMSPQEKRQHPWAPGGKGGLRVAVVGDSITEGAGVQNYDTYAQRLEYLLNLNEKPRPAAVRVWAKGGLNTYLETRCLDEVMAWKPDVLILGMCLNDAEDQQHYRQLVEWRDDSVPRVPPPRLARFLRHTRVGSWMWQKAQDLRARRGYLRYYERLYSADYSGWQKMVEGIGTFAGTCRKANVRLLVVLFPLMSDVDRYPFDAVHRQIRGVLEQEQVRCLDLLEIYRGMSPYRLQAVPNVDAHPNEIGHRIAAEAIFNYLVANSLVDIHYNPSITHGSPKRKWRIIESFVQNAAGADRADRDALSSEAAGKGQERTP